MATHKRNATDATALPSTSEVARRRVLQGAAGLAAVSVLGLSACDDSGNGGSGGGGQGGTTTGGTSGGGGTSAGGTTSGGSKQPQEAVNYQTEPKGDQQCANCANFLPAEGACTVVQGNIVPNGWCTLWTKAG